MVETFIRYNEYKWPTFPWAECKENTVKSRFLAALAINLVLRTYWTQINRALLYRERLPILQPRDEEDSLGNISVKITYQGPSSTIYAFGRTNRFKVIGCLLPTDWTKLWSSALGVGFFACTGEGWAICFWHLGCWGQPGTLGNALRKTQLRIRLMFGLKDQMLIQSSFCPRTQLLPFAINWTTWWQAGLLLGSWAWWHRFRSASWPSFSELWHWEMMHLNGRNAVLQSFVAPHHQQAVVIWAVCWGCPTRIQKSSVHLCPHQACCPGHHTLSLASHISLESWLFPALSAHRKEIFLSRICNEVLGRAHANPARQAKGDRIPDSEDLEEDLGKSLIARRLWASVKCGIGRDDLSSLSVPWLPHAVTTGECHQHDALSWAEKTKAH